MPHTQPTNLHARRLLAQRRKGAKRYRVSEGFLCAFAPLREKYFLFTTTIRTFRAIPLLVLLFAMSILRGSSTALAQSEDVSINDKPKTVKKQQAPDDGKNKKTDKRGSLVIAPIPISSPAFGSGLLLISGYVFKFNERDQISPPSWLGGAGAFTNNGSRALALGGRLYLQENKYQTTFAAMKGRANLDFFGIGRIPHKDVTKIAYVFLYDGKTSGWTF